MSKEALASALQDVTDYKATSYDERSRERQTEFLPLCIKIFEIKGITTAVAEDGKQVLKTNPVKIKTDKGNLSVWMQWSYSPDAHTVEYSGKEYEFGPYTPELSLKIGTWGETLDYFSSVKPHIHNANEESANNEEFREYMEVLNSLHDYYSAESRKPRGSKQANSNQERLAQALRNAIIRADQHYLEELYKEQDRLEEQFREIFEIEDAKKGTEVKNEYAYDESSRVPLTLKGQQIIVWATRSSAGSLGPLYSLKLEIEGETIDYFGEDYSILNSDGNVANLAEMIQYNKILKALMDHYRETS